MEKTYNSNSGTSELLSSPLINNYKNKNNSSKFLKILKETLNLPFISGIVAIILSTLPFVSNQIDNKHSIIYKIIIGRLHIKNIFFKTLLVPCNSLGESSSSFVILILGINLTISIDSYRKMQEEELNLENKLNKYIQNFFN